MAEIITPEYFEGLSIDEKADILWSKGTFLNEIVDYGKGKANIYELQGFYVGVFYNITSNYIQRIEILNSNVSELVNNIRQN